MTPLLKATKPKLYFRARAGLVTGIIGLSLLLPIGQGLQNMSFDLPFCFRSRLAATNAVVVYLNNESLQAVLQANGPLKQETLRTTWPPDHRIYSRLLKTMKADGARLVFFDLDFSSERVGEEDQTFAQAIKDTGLAILGGTVEFEVQQSGADPGGLKERVLPPNDMVRSAVKKWGLLVINKGDKAQQIFLGNDQLDAAVLIAARTNNFKGDTHTVRWLNFYGPPYTIDHVLLTDALNPEKASQFQNRAVFVGGGDPLISNGGDQPDLHPTPYSDFGDQETTGVEILATSYLNLVQHDWLERVPFAMQGVIIVGWGLASVAFFLFFRPRNIILLAPILIFVIMAAGFYTQWQHHHWWSWAIPAFVQTPIAAGWAAIANRWYPWPPTAFISYRRVEGEGGGYAQAVWSELEHRGYGAICDVQAELTTREFRPQLMELIDSVPNFILILSRDVLKPERINNEDDVLRAEIRHALNRGKNIILVMIGEYKMPPTTQLPPDIQQLPGHHAFVWRDEDPWPVMQKIVANLRRPSLNAWLRPFKKSARPKAV